MRGIVQEIRKTKSKGTFLTVRTFKDLVNRIKEKREGASESYICKVKDKKLCRVMKR